MKKTTVKKLVIELNGKDVELSMEQARELQASLNELFGENVRDRPYPVPQPYPVPDPWPRRPFRWPWYQPSWISPSGTRFSVDTGDSMRCMLKSDSKTTINGQN